jgi:hypothetical protein
MLPSNRNSGGRDKLLHIRPWKRQIHENEKSAQDSSPLRYTTKLLVVVVVSTVLAGFLYCRIPVRPTGLAIMLA